MYVVVDDAGTRLLLREVRHMRFEQSRHPELVEGLLAMGKLEHYGDLVRGVQRPSAAVRRVLKLRHALTPQPNESAGERTRRRHWRQPFTEVIAPQNLAMRVKVEAKHVEVRVWRVDRLAGCPRSAARSIRFQSTPPSVCASKAAPAIASDASRSTSANPDSQPLAVTSPMSRSLRPSSQSPRA